MSSSKFLNTTLHLKEQDSVTIKVFLGLLYYSVKNSGKNGIYLNFYKSKFHGTITYKIWEEELLTQK